MFRLKRQKKLPLPQVSSEKDRLMDTRQEFSRRKPTLPGEDLISQVHKHSALRVTTEHQLETLGLRHWLG